MTTTVSPRALFRALTGLTAAALLLAVPVAGLQAQNPDWTRPFPGHRVIGNLYAVGTYGLGVFLIASDEGHILINTGLEDSTPLIRENIESVGFRLDDVRILLTMQAHWDHTAALAEIKEITGAGMWATSGDGRVLEDGGFSDPHFGGRVSFRPVEVDRIISDGEIIELGEIRLRVHEHPGHTEGSSSYSMQVSENGRDYDVVVANMGTINDGKKLVVDPTYPVWRRILPGPTRARRPWMSMSGSRRTVASTACTTSTSRGRRTIRIRLSIRTGCWLRSSDSSASTRNNWPRNGAEFSGHPVPGSRFVPRRWHLGTLHAPEGSRPSQGL